VYEDIVAKLVQHGVPRAQIACMGEADTDGKKQALFTRVQQGTVRILLGSTQKMGTGTNVQQRLVAVHHLDSPWKPAEVEQRDGRILRVHLPIIWHDCQVMLLVRHCHLFCQST
jgi:hypothetical protein